MATTRALTLELEHLWFTRRACERRGGQSRQTCSFGPGTRDRPDYASSYRYPGAWGEFDVAPRSGCGPSVRPPAAGAPDSYVESDSIRGNESTCAC